MRAVVQRVRHARVVVAGEEIASSGPGLLALVGVGHDDGEADADALAAKLVHLRIFRDEQGQMNRSLRDVGGELTVVSQFTLLGDARKGRRPAFTAAAAPDQAEPLVDRVVAAARAEGVTVVTGRFGADMDVHLCNEGPVTILLDTQRSF